MKKSRFLWIFLVAVSLTVFLGAKKPNQGNLISTSPNKIVVKFNVDAYDFERVQTPQGEAVVVNAPHSGRFLKKGVPDLVKLSEAVIIPDRGNMRVEVLDASFIELDHVKIAPSKGNLLRTQNPENVPYVYGEEYNRDAFYPGKLAELNKAYIARDFRGQGIVAYPFQYNPVTGILRVYTEMTLKISRKGGKGDNEFDRQKPLNFKKLHREFKNVYARHFLNYQAMEQEGQAADAELQYTLLDDPIGKMLIVSYSGFMADMSEFVSWKQSIGYDVDLVDYAAIGSSSALKTYVANYYSTNGLTFLLLVGDHAQVPTSGTSYGDSDNNYGYIVGSDHYLDIFVGRFSAETSTQVQTQVERTLHYERDVLSTADFFRHAIGTGSSEGPGHNGEYDYQHINLILDDLEGYGYTGHECHESGGSPSLMTNLINAGAGTIFYCGHGSITQWYMSSWQYTNTNVDNLVNEYQLPFVVSVACQVGNFKNYTCYCETWLRATNNGNPTGAVAHAGSTINQSWNPPMDAEDEMADLLVAGSVRTFGGMLANGMFKMIDLNGSAGESMADTWTCFGDSSVQMRTPGTPDGPNPGNRPPVADFTYYLPTGDLTVVFEDQSYDPDGTIVAWDWDFGDSSTSAEQNPTHTYAAAGSYSVTLTVTDDDGATGTVTKIVTVGSQYMYVYDIAMSIKKMGKNYAATAVITIMDTNNNPVPDATVNVTWSGCYSATTSGVTGPDGTVTFQTPKVKCSGPFIITVNNATHASIVYDPALNNETSDTISY